MKTILSLMAIALSTSALADTTIRCEAPAGASTGMTLTVATNGAVRVATPAGENWLTFARPDGAGFVMATLVSVRPEGTGFAWERVEFMIDRRVPTQADTNTSRLANQGRTPLNARVLATFARPLRERVNCQVSN